MSSEQLAYASKASTSVFSPFERRLAQVVLPKIPSWLETYHLTWLTLVWSALIALFSFFAAREIR